MDSRKEAKLNMYHAVIKLCDDNPAIVGLVPAFESSYNLLKTTANGITASNEVLIAQTGGWRISKKTAKRKLAEMCASVAGQVFAFASVVNDEVLKGAMDIASSDIFNAKDEEVGPKCMNVYEAANANLGMLGDYGVTGGLLLAFQTAIANYVALVPKPVMSQNLKKAERVQMNRLFAEADKILKERMDKLAANFLGNNHALFYAEYFAAREITKPGSYSTVLKIFVVNGANNMPLRNVKCYRDESEVVKRSSKKGFVTYKNAEQGHHIFKLKRKAFADASVQAMVGYGEKKVVSVVMMAK